MSEKKEVTRDSNITVYQDVNSNNCKNESNKAWVSGIFEEEFEYSHEVMWEKFYKTRVIVVRNSGTEDYIPLMVSGLLMANIPNGSLKGKYVEVGGQFRSHNRLGEDGKYHLELFLFVDAINVYEDVAEAEIVDSNMIYLEGYICKQPNFRITPLGRQITDLLLAVNRSYNKSDYIPCIAWGRAAYYASDLEIGNKIKMYGRIQSRKYFKRYSIDSDVGEEKEVYEISIMRIKKVEELLLED